MHQEVVHEKDHYHPNFPDLLAPYPSYHEYFPLLSVLEILAWHLGVVLDLKIKNIHMEIKKFNIQLRD